MTGATNDSAEEPCYPDRRAVTDARPAGAIPSDMKELLAMLQDIERTLQVERNAGTTDGPQVSSAVEPTPSPTSTSRPGLAFVPAALVVEAAKAREVEPELALRSGDDVELFLGQLPFGFSYAALAEGLQRLADAPCQLVTRMKPGPKPTCAFISVIKEYAPRLASLNKRVLCERNGFRVATLASGSEGLAELDAQVKLRVTNHVIGLPAHPLVIEPVVCKSKAGLNQRTHDVQFTPPAPGTPPSYGQFVGDHAWWPFAPPCPPFQPYYNLYGSGVPIAPIAAYPPPLTSMPPAASLRCAPPFHAPMLPLARPLVSVAPYVKQCAKAHAQTRHPAA